MNGPGFRWAVRSLAPTLLERRLGLEGSVGEVSGTLLSGVGIDEIHFEASESSPSVIRRLEADEVAVEYEPRAIRRDRPWRALQAVRLSGVVAEIDLDRAGSTSPDSEKKDPAPGEGSRGWRDLVWDFLDVRVEIDDVTVRVLRDGQVWEAEGFSLRHDPGSNEGRIALRSLTMPDGSREGQYAAPIESSERSVAIGPLAIDESFELLRISLEREGDPMVTGRIRGFGGVLAVAFHEEARRVDARLAEGRIDAAAALRAFDVAGPEEAMISRFGADVVLGEGFPAAWDWSIEAEVEDAIYRGVRVDTLVLQGSCASGMVAVNARATRGGGSIRAALTADWSSVTDAASLRSQPIEADLDLAVPEVAEIIPTLAEAQEIEGGLEGELTGRLVEFAPVDLDGVLRSTGLACRGVDIESAELAFSGEDHEMIVARLAVTLDESNQLRVDGSVRTAERTYDAEGRLALAATPKTRELARRFDVSEELRGTANLVWRGSGPFSPGGHEGDATLGVQQGGYGASLPPVDLEAEIGYDPERIEVGRVAADFGRFAGALSASWQNNQANIEDFSVSADGETLASGRFSAPLDPEALGGGVSGFFGQEGPVALRVRVPSISADRVGELLEREIPVTGTLQLDLDLNGSTRDLDGGGRLSIDDLRARGQEGTKAVASELELTIGSGAVRVDGMVRHPDVEPLRLNAEFGFHPEEWAEGGFDPAGEEFALSLSMPKSSLAFVAGLAAPIEEMVGTVSLDVRAGGTFADPTLEGRIDLDVPSLRPASRSVPSIRDLSGRIALAGRRVRIESLGGVVSGGRVEISGAIDAEDGVANPVLDLTISAREALVARTRELNLRCDADLRLSGPWEEATLAGSIGTRGGRYARTFDLIPAKFGAGARPLPEVERPGSAARSRIELGTDLMPFRNWKVDVTVRSLEPFLVRSNLGRADVEADLSVTGTGQQLVPTGRVRALRGRIILPFSEIVLSEAVLVFSETTLFNPSIAVEGQSEVGGHQIRLIGYGTVTEPRVILTSSPPLPQEDIISLLSTGVTTSTLTGGDGSVALSRAAMFLLDDLTGGSQRRGEDRVGNALRSRVRIEPGQVDPRTGETVIGGRIDFWKGLSMIGAMGFEGDYRALLRYVFRFR